MAFAASMAIVFGALQLSARETKAGFLAYTPSVVAPDGAIIEPDDKPIFRIATELKREQWTDIVIHHLGKPAGDAQSISRMHESFGYVGMGYHFLIGNGNGLGNGVVHVGFRWNQQLPGAHVAGPNGEYQNQHAIGICLVGNGDRRAFSDEQITQLVRLVRALQRELDIPPHRVHLSREVTEGTTSPGRFFPAAEIRAQLFN